MGAQSALGPLHAPINSCRSHCYRGVYYTQSQPMQVLSDVWCMGIVLTKYYLIIKNLARNYWLRASCIQRAVAITSTYYIILSSQKPWEVDNFSSSSFFVCFNNRWGPSSKLSTVAQVVELRSGTTQLLPRSLIPSGLRPPWLTASGVLNEDHGAVTLGSHS